MIIREAILDDAKGIAKVEVEIAGKKFNELVYGWDNIKGVFEK